MMFLQQWVGSALPVKEIFPEMMQVLTYMGGMAPFIRATGAIGPGIVFIIAGAATSINGIIFMSSIFRHRFLVMYIAVVFTIALIAGYVLSFIG